MENKKLENLLAKGCRELGVALSRQSLENLAWYFRELNKWNRKVNLIARAEEQEIIDKHFLDSLALLPILTDIKTKSMLDLGTGAGFPGLVLKTALPDLELLLVEARMKKTAFLRHIIRNLKLTNVEIMAARLERAPPEARKSAFPLIVSRAFASINSFLDLIGEYSPPDGGVICMKGPRAEEEIEEWRSSQPDSPFRLHFIHHYQLPSPERKELLLSSASYNNSKSIRLCSLKPVSPAAQAFHLSAAAFSIEPALLLRLLVFESDLFSILYY